MSQTLPKSNSLSREQAANIQPFVPPNGSHLIPVIMSPRNISSSSHFQNNAVHGPAFLLSTSNVPTGPSNSVQISEQTNLGPNVRAQPSYAVRVLSTGNTHAGSQILQKQRIPFVAQSNNTLSNSNVAQLINGPSSTKLVSANNDSNPARLLIHKQAHLLGSQPANNQNLSNTTSLVSISAISSPNQTTNSDPTNTQKQNIASNLIALPNPHQVSTSLRGSSAPSNNPALVSGLIYATSAPSGASNPSTGGVFIGSNSAKTLVPLPSINSKALASTSPAAALVKSQLLRGIPISAASSISSSVSCHSSHGSTSTTLALPSSNTPTNSKSALNEPLILGTNSPPSSGENATSNAKTSCRPVSPSNQSFSTNYLLASNRKRARKQHLTNNQSSEQRSNSSTPPPVPPCSPSPPAQESRGVTLITGSSTNSRAVAAANIIMMSNAAVMTSFGDNNKALGLKNVSLEDLSEQRNLQENGSTESKPPLAIPLMTSIPVSSSSFPQLPTTSSVSSQPTGSIIPLKLIPMSMRPASTVPATQSNTLVGQNTSGNKSALTHTALPNGLFVVTHPATLLSNSGTSLSSVESGITNSNKPEMQISSELQSGSTQTSSLPTFILANSTGANTQTPLVSLSSLEAALSHTPSQASNSLLSGVFQLKYRASASPQDGNAQFTVSSPPLMTSAIASTNYPSQSPVATLLSPATSQTPITTSTVVTALQSVSPQQLDQRKRNLEVGGTLLQTPPNQWSLRPFPDSVGTTWIASSGSSGPQSSNLTNSPGNSSLYAVTAAVNVLSRAANENNKSINISPISNAKYENISPHSRNKTPLGQQYSSISSSCSSDSPNSSVYGISGNRCNVQAVVQRPGYAKFVKSGHFLKLSEMRFKTPSHNELGFAFSFLNEPSNDSIAPSTSTGVGPRRGGGEFNLRKRPAASVIGQIGSSRPSKTPRKSTMNYIQDSEIDEENDKRLSSGAFDNNASESPISYSNQDTLQIAFSHPGGACSYEKYCMWHSLIELRDRHSETQHIRHPLATTSSLDLTGWRLLHSANGLTNLFESELQTEFCAKSLERNLNILANIRKSKSTNQNKQIFLEPNTTKKLHKLLEMIKGLQQRNQLMSTKISEIYSRSRGLLERHRYPALLLFDDLGKLLEPLDQEQQFTNNGRRSASYKTTGKPFVSPALHGSISGVICEVGDPENDTAPAIWSRFVHNLAYSETSSSESVGLHKPISANLHDVQIGSNSLDDPLQRPNRRKELLIASTSTLSSATISSSTSPSPGQAGSLNPLTTSLLAMRKIR